MSEQLTMTMMPRVDLNVEIPEDLYQVMQGYLDTHPAWSQHQVFCAALSMFLIQNGVSDPRVNRFYLDALFDYAS